MTLAWLGSSSGNFRLGGKVNGTRQNEKNEEVHFYDDPCEQWLGCFVGGAEGGRTATAKDCEKERSMQSTYGPFSWLLFLGVLHWRRLVSS